MSINEKLCGPEDLHIFGTPDRGDEQDLGK